MAKDPYYTALYRAKKEYYTGRPDLVALKDTKKGWKGWVDNMSKRWMVKILTSHAWEIMRRSEGLPVNPHHGYIPPKPIDTEEQREVLERVVPNLLRGIRMGEPCTPAS
jgi:hypothetical protein